jgi:bacterioferritin-associated ferredoxin
MSRNVHPGIITASAFEYLAAQSAVPANSRIVVAAPASQANRIAEAAAKAGCRIDVYLADGPVSHPAISSVAEKLFPVAVDGATRIKRLRLNDGSWIDCDVLVTGYLQPSYEFQMQAGCHVEFDGVGSAITVTGLPSFPLLTLDGDVSAEDIPDIAGKIEAWRQGEAFKPVSPAPMPGPDLIADDAMVCPCEDVRAGDIRAAWQDGFDTIEHLKRRTGAGTGPCQGKLCHALLVQTVTACGGTVELPTIRPLARPVRLSSFGGSSDG